MQAEPAGGASDGVGDAELAEAAAGGGGSQPLTCDMALRLQSAMHGDPRVQAAVGPLAKGPAPHAFRVWNGDWVVHPGQDGRGLAAVREAILWEVGFAPKACREAEVEGLVLIAVDDGAGGDVRLALGARRWRWSDLLTPRRQAAG